MFHRLNIALTAALLMFGVTQAAAGTLSGTVTGNGTAMSGAVVEALADGTTTVVGSSTTNGSGQYSLSIADGTYDLRVTPPAGIFTATTIQNVAVSGATTYNVALVAVVAQGQITGTVRGLGGQPLSNVNIWVYSANWTFLTFTTTDANGNYSALANNGDVNIQFRGGSSSSPYQPSSWNGYVFNRPVSGATTIDFDLPVVTLSGTVRGSDGAALSGAQVSAQNACSSTATHQYCSEGYVTSGAGGAYSMLLLPASSRNFSVSPPSGTDYTPISDSNVSVMTSTTRDFTLPAAVRVSGTVRGLGGQPLSNVNVWVYSANWVFLGFSTTNANGVYSAVATNGNVNIQFRGGNSSSPYQPSSWNGYVFNRPVSGATTIDFDLPVVTLSGTVRGSDGAALSGAQVSAQNACSSTATHQYCSEGYVTSGAGGAYSMLLLPATSRNFSVSPPSGANYTPINDSSVSVMTSTTRDFTLPAAVRVSGTVRGLGGQPLSNVNVWVYSANWVFLGFATTDANGVYSAVATNGDVNIQFRGGSSSSPYQPSSWNGYVFNRPVSGPTTIDYDPPFLRLSGAATDSNGAGVPGVQLYVSNFCQSNATTQLCSEGSASTSSTGAFSMLLGAGTATLNVTPPSQSGFLPVSFQLSMSGNVVQRIVLQKPDLAPPQITAGPLVVHLSDNSVSVSWITNEPSNSRVEYGVGNTGTTALNAALTTSHEITLLNLTPTAIYNFRVGSTDPAGNGPTYSSVGSFATQAPPGDITPPTTLSGPTVVFADQTTAIVEWTTDEPATTSLSYGLTDALGTAVAGSPTTFTLHHSVRITGLSAETAYRAQVSSADPDGNVASSSVFGITTLAVPDTAAPLVTTGPTVVAKTNTTITIAWETNEPATSGVSANDGTRFFTVTDAALTRHHQATLTGLSPQTLYHITTSSTDAVGNGPTLAGPIDVTTAATADTTPPVLSGGTITDVTVNSAIVRWTTDELSTSVVRYGTSSGNLDQSVANVSTVLQHAINLTGLRENTVYFLTISSADSSGHSRTSEEVSFRTASTFVDQPPTAPGPITAPESATNAAVIELAWGASTDDVGVVSYEVIRDNEVIALVAGHTTSFNDESAGEGEHTYAIRVTDTADHQVLSESVTFIVDRTAPELFLPSDIAFEASAALTAVTFDASAHDAFSGSLTVMCDPASGSLFPIVETHVVCTATDAAGNTAAGQFVVAGRDSMPPVLAPIPADFTVNADNNGIAVLSYLAPSASDLVDGSVAVTCSPATGEPVGVGMHVVTCTAGDQAGNDAEASFTVTVLDVTPPAIDSRADIRVEAASAAGALVTYALPEARDAVDGSLTVTCAPASGSTFALGTTTVTCTAADASGNRGSTSFTVMVRDTTAPAITVPATIAVDATSPAGAVVTFAVAATDAVDGSITPVCVPASGSTFAVASTQVNCTATDSRANSQSAAFTVVVRGADTQLTGLLAIVKSLNFQQGVNLLQNALQNLNGGNTAAACNQVAAFLNQVKAQTGKSLTPQQAASLTQSANTIRAAMGCK